MTRILLGLGSKCARSTGIAASSMVPLATGLYRRWRALLVVAVAVALSGIGFQAAAIDYSRAYGAPGGAMRFVAGTADNAGNVIGGGTIFGAPSFDIGGVSIPLVGYSDGVVAKLDGAGAATWVRSFGGALASTIVEDVATDGFGNVYVAGLFADAALSNPPLPLKGVTDGFIVKLDGSGNRLWARSLGGRGTEITSIRVAATGAGEAYVAGSFKSAGLAWPPLALTGGEDAFVLKLDAAGNILWTKHWSGGNVDSAVGIEGMAVDRLGGVAVGGHLQNGDLPSLGLTRIGDADAFVVRLNAGGDALWARNYGGTGSDAYGRSMAFDASGNLHFIGVYGSADLTTPVLTRYGEGDGFAFKIDTSGNMLWARHFGGAGHTRTDAYGVALDSAGNFYISGRYSGAMTWPPFTRLGYWDGFALAFDAGGTLAWAMQIGGAGATAVGQGLAVDHAGNLSIAGGFEETNLTVPPLTQLGSSTAFIIKRAVMPTARLTATFGGSGNGTVSSIPEGIACGIDCGETYVRNTTVSMIATPAAGSIFVGWGGNCSGFRPCTLTLGGDRSAAAGFKWVGMGTPYTSEWVQRAYVAYYGRPGDPDGLAWWSQRMYNEGGSLASIISAFGVSREFTDRYGGLTNSELLDRLYQQTLGRLPDPAGKAWYLDRLDRGLTTLQTITLDLLGGATGLDAYTVANRLDAANHFTGKVANGCRYGGELAGVTALASVTADPYTAWLSKLATEVHCGG